MATMRGIDLEARTVLRTVLIVLTVVLTVYIMYLLRKPISWLVIAAFVAIAVSGPVALLSRRLPRGLAIATVYLTLLAVPIALAGLLIPPLVGQAEDLAGDVPGYVNDVKDFVNENETLANLNEDYDIVSKLEEEAGKLPSKIGDAANILSDIGVGLVNSIFAVVTILILSIFMVASGGRWVDRFVEMQDEEHRERLRRTFDSIAGAIGSYVGAALAQAVLAGIFAFIVLTILGAPFAGALALIVTFGDLIPLVGATIAAFLVGIVMLFVNFPVGLIIWIVYAIAFQQIEDYVIRPQIQRRAVNVEPMVILIAVLFGATLFGVIGALLAIPAAASVQIVIKEFIDYRRAFRVSPPPAPPPPAAPPPAGATPSADPA
jgi:predicted PurR-regulated permease PerM